MKNWIMRSWPRLGLASALLAALMLFFSPPTSTAATCSTGNAPPDNEVTLVLDDNRDLLEVAATPNDWGSSPVIPVSDQLKSYVMTCAECPVPLLVDPDIGQRQITIFEHWNKDLTSITTSIAKKCAVEVGSGQQLCDPVSLGTSQGEQLAALRIKARRALAPWRPWLA